PESRAALTTSPGLISEAVNTALWTTPPLQTLVGRYPVRDVELAGVPIRAGECLVLGFAAASLDLAQHSDADTMSTNRAPLTGEPRRTHHLARADLRGRQHGAVDHPAAANPRRPLPRPGRGTGRGSHPGGRVPRAGLRRGQPRPGAAQRRGHDVHEPRPPDLGGGPAQLSPPRSRHGSGDCRNRRGTAAPPAP